VNSLDRLFEKSCEEKISKLFFKFFNLFFTQKCFLMRLSLAITLVFALSLFGSATAQNYCGIQGVSTPVSCPGASNGGITLQILNPGFPGGYTYQWSNGMTTQNLVSIPAGAYTVTVTYIWQNDGCQSTTSVVVGTAADNQPPTVICPANQTVNAGSNCTGIVGSWSAVSVSDNCTPTGNISVTQSPAASTVLVGNNDTKSVTLTANDGHGNTTSCSFTVMLKDATPPSITCPANVTLNTSAATCGASFNYSAPCADDNCGLQSVNLLSGLPSGATFPTGFTTVTWKATDAAGNTATCLFNVTVLDQTPPSITCPASQLVTATSGCTATAFYAMPTAADNCSNVAITQQSGLPSGSTFPTGLTTVTWKATDAAGNTATCNFVIVVSCAPAQPPCSLFAAAASIPATCNVSNGAVNLTVAGGTSTYFYQWSNGQTTQNLGNVPAGTYSVTVINASCTTTTSTVVTCTTAPPPSCNLVSVALATPSVCNQSTGSINLSVAGGTMPYTYDWSNDGAEEMPDNDPEDLSGLSAGTYTVTITDTNGCTTMTVVEVTCTQAPPSDSDGDGTPDAQDCAPFNAAIHPGAQELCGNGVDDNCDGQIDEGCPPPCPLPVAAFTSSVSGATATFTNTSTGATSFLWNFGDGSTSTATSPAHTYVSANTYTVTLTAHNDCGNVTTNNSVTIACMPPEVWGPSDITINNNQSAVLNVLSTGTTINWITPFGYGCNTCWTFVVQGAFSQPGIYELTYIVNKNSGCSYTGHVWVTITGNATGTSGPEGLKHLNVFPNPTDGEFAVQVLDTGKVTFTLANLAGQEIQNEIRTVNQGTDEWFDFTALNPGIYFLRTTNEKGDTRLAKIVKQ
jgi:PKD repeat protein